MLLPKKRFDLSQLFSIKKFENKKISSGYAGGSKI